MNGNATPPGRIDEFDFAEGGADERLLAESIPSTPSRSRTPPAQHQSLASWLRSAVLSLPAPLQNAAFGAAAFARRNSRILVLAVVAVTVLVSVVKLREEVQDFYEDLEEERREWGGGYDSPTWAEGQRGEVETVHGDKIRPGDLLIHPDQKDTVRAMVLELMARFNRITYQCTDMVKMGGTGGGTEGTWPVCFDAPYWKKEGDRYVRASDSLDSKNKGADGKCVQYTFGVDWDFSFDDAFSKATGCDSHSFDPSMEMESTHRSPQNWYWNLGISDKKDVIQGKGMRSGKTAMWHVDTVGGHMKTLKHEHLAVLKIDVEGFEWPVLRETIDSGVLGHVDQLLFEIHLWDGQGAFGSDDKRVEVLHEWHKIIADLENERGFRLFYVNTNPMSSQVDFKTGFSIPCCYEVGYVKAKPHSSKDHDDHDDDD